jgi:hypothetical protein
MGRMAAGVLLAGLGVVDHVGKIVVSGIERLHFGGAIIALVARGDAFLVAAQRVDDLGDGRRSAIGEMAAIGLVGIRGHQQRERDEASGQAMQSAFHSGHNR